MASKYFSRQEAEKLLPLIEASLRQAREEKQALDALQEEFSQAASKIMVLGGSFPPYSDLVKKKSEREQASTRVVDAITKIQETGCVVKDLDEGLVDFPSIIEGQEAFLCWKLGEPRIEYWHDLEEGFAGRKPIDPEEPASGSTRIH